MKSPENQIDPVRELCKPQRKPKPVRKCHVCGANVTYCNYNRHVKTKKHCDAEYVNFEKFEMK